MFDHIGVRVSDLEASIQFYSAVLSPLGFELCSHDDNGAGFGPAGAPALWLHRAAEARGAFHLAFRATTRHAVDAFHRAGRAAGGGENGAPGVRHDYGPTYYAAFLLDPDGNNVEAVCAESE